MGPAIVGGSRTMRTVRAVAQARSRTNHDVITTPALTGALRVVGALAFTLGEELHFAPGSYDPTSRDGVALLGHELAHVVQQRAGRVRNPYGHGVAIVQDPVLEAEADRLGQQIAARIVSGLRTGSMRLPNAVQRRRAVGVAQPSREYTLDENDPDELEDVSGNSAFWYTGEQQSSSLSLISPPLLTPPKLIVTIPRGQPESLAALEIGKQRFKTLSLGLGGPLPADHPRGGHDRAAVHPAHARPQERGQQGCE